MNNNLNVTSNKKIFITKGRKQDNPLILHVSNKIVHDLIELSRVPSAAPSANVSSKILKIYKIN